MKATPLSEFFGPIEKGCFHCYEGEPEEAMDWGLLCTGCGGEWFPGRSKAWMDEWLQRQRDLFEAIQARQPEPSFQISIFGFLQEAWGT